ncbi:Pr6Pr family membrane protein [Streptomyces mexicanus]|uniref:Pr6Pr family membrane protein n=1 Tax=Streptomyces mexicanus TaxID=178566 RepID=A0A7X1HXN1_9ACTN|nr:Pr6Pr family membrane protein [Streptomyces mexicanus]
MTAETSPIPPTPPPPPQSATPSFPREIPDLPAVPGMPVLMPSAVPAAAVVPPVRRPWAAAYRLLIAVVAAGAVALEMLTGPPLRVLSHVEIQTAIALALVLALSARRAWTARRPLPAALTGAVTLYVTTAALIHHLFLTATSPPYSITGSPGTHPLWQSTAGHLLHTALPLAALLDWLLLTAPARLHLRQTAPWMLYPLAYLAFCLTRGALLPPTEQDRYLYPFLDAARHGYKHVLGNALLLGLACYGLGLLLVVLDHVRPNPIRRAARTGFRLRPPVG